jgi:hypothetical protein
MENTSMGHRISRTLFGVSRSVEKEREEETQPIVTKEEVPPAKTEVVHHNVSHVQQETPEQRQLEKQQTQQKLKKKTKYFLKAEGLDVWVKINTREVEYVKRHSTQPLIMETIPEDKYNFKVFISVKKAG